MKERGVLFSGEMVRELLAGTKTQTRRVVKIPAARASRADLWEPSQIFKGRLRYFLDGFSIDCPYGRVGDRLWVRETWQHGDSPARPIVYRASDEATLPPMKWKPGIHLRRVDARITLELTDVRVQRLRDISEEDALAEGISAVDFYPDDGYPPSVGYMVGPDDKRSKLDPSPIETYARLWDEINGVGSWAANPWVWALTFAVVKS
jgi:hypothetical protein